jgi:hypothetical protein
MAQRIRDAIGVSHREVQEVGLLDGEQIFGDLVEAQVQPPAGKRVSFVQRISVGDVTFEAADKLCGIAFDSRVAVESQPEFGMVVFATPG